MSASRYDFDDADLPIDFQWLRTPWPEKIFSLSARPGHLRLYGRETAGSMFRQALVARDDNNRIDTIAETLMDFHPEHFQHQAGLICYYNSSKFFYST